MVLTMPVIVLLTRIIQLVLSRTQQSRNLRVHTFDRHRLRLQTLLHNLKATPFRPAELVRSMKQLMLLHQLFRVIFFTRRTERHIVNRR